MLKTLIIGCGNVAGGYDLRAPRHEVWTHAKAYQLTPGVELAGVVDVSPKQAREFARTWKVPYHGTHVRDAVLKLQPDLVSLCSPTPTHAPFIAELVRLGVRGILCEKPLSYSRREAVAALRLCRKQGIVFAVNYQRNWDLRLRALGQALRNGEYGKVHLVRVLYSKGLIHNGSHFISLLQSWFGSLVVDDILAVRKGAGKDLYVDFTASSKVVPRLIFQNIPEDAYVLNEVELFCGKGRLELRRGALDIRWTGKTANPLLPADGMLATKTSKLRGTLPRAMLEVIRNVTATMRGEETLVSDPENALETLRLCEQVRSLSQKIKSYA